VETELFEQLARITPPSLARSRTAATVVAVGLALLRLFDGFTLRRDISDLAPVELIGSRVSTSAIEAAMRDLVHARFPRPHRVTLAHGEQHEGGLLGLRIARENRPPLTRWLRDVELHAAFEARAVLTFLFATQEPLARRALVAQRVDHRPDSRSRRRCATSEILREHLLDDPDLKARTRARAHDPLSLAVGWERSEVPIKFLRAHRRGPGALANLLD
jgi:hypothetical protein